MSDLPDFYDYEVVTFNVSDDAFKRKIDNALHNLTFRGFRLHTAIPLDRGTFIMMFETKKHHDDIEQETLWRRWEVYEQCGGERPDKYPSESYCLAKGYFKDSRDYHKARKRRMATMDELLDSDYDDYDWLLPKSGK